MKTIKANKNENSLPALLSDFFDNDRFFNNRWLEREFEHTMPAVNIKETGKNYEVEFAAPGFSKTDFKISVDNNMLTISAEKKNEKNENNDRFTRKEFSYNSFSRSFTLPQTVNSEKIDAKYTDGILKLAVPKKDPEKTGFKKEIKIA